MRRLARLIAVTLSVIAFAYAIASVGAASTSRVWHITGAISRNDIAADEQGQANIESSFAKLHGEVASLKAHADGSRRHPDAATTEEPSGDLTGAVPAAGEISQRTP